MTLRIKQDSTYQGNHWWRWSVWLEGTPKELNAVDHVVYTLHPTFPNPVRRMENRRQGFKLESSGWGEFEIYVQIKYKNGVIRKRKHSLKLAYPTNAEQETQTKRPATRENGPLAIISSGSADATFARTLRETLTQQGFRVISAEDTKGLPPDRALDESMRSVDVAIFVLSGRPSLWTNLEIESALAQNVPHIIPVIIGTATEIPSQLQGLQALNVNSPTELDALAKQIMKTALGSR
jgi:transcription initiation factor IIF auxiliary subunit